VEEYDPATDRWTTKKTDMPAPRSDLATSVVNGKIYAIGGCIGPPQAPQPSSIVEEYDPVTDRWTRKADMPTARGFLSASAVNGKIYAIGGWMLPNVYLSTVEEYDTGFAGVNVEATDKLATTWGKVKAGD
jgi:N-acetylneuraminic acid mutarotase